MRVHFKLVVLICLGRALLASADMRVWTDQNGQPFAGEFDQSAFSKVMIRDSEGVVRSIPMNQMSAADLEYVFYHVPPKLEITVRRKDRELPKYEWSSDTFDTTLYTFTARLKKISQLEYKGSLFTEFFIVGEDRVRRSEDHFVLMQYSRLPFSFSNENAEEPELTLRDVRFYRYDATTEVQDAVDRGKDYVGYLIIVSDMDGRMIAYKDDLPNESWMKEDISRTAGEFRGIYAAGNGAPDSCHFDSSFRKVSPPRMPWFERSEEY